MGKAKLKSTGAQLKACRKYNETIDRVSIALPKGTKERIKNVGLSYSEFIVATILEELDRLEGK